MNLFRLRFPSLDCVTLFSALHPLAEQDFITREKTIVGLATQEDILMACTRYNAVITGVAQFVPGKPWWKRWQRPPRPVERVRVQRSDILHDPPPGADPVAHARRMSEELAAWIRATGKWVEPL